MSEDMHRIHDVFQRVLVVAFPRGGTQEVAVVFGVGQLCREAQFIRLLVGCHAEPQKNSAVCFLYVVAAHALLAHQRAFIDGGDIFHFAVAGDFYTVIPAGNAVAEVPAHRQARTAVRAAIFQRLNLTVLVTPDHDLLAKTGDPHRGGLHLPAGQYRIPKAAQAFVEIMLYGCRHRLALSSR